MVLFGATELYGGFLELQGAAFSVKEHPMPNRIAVGLRVRVFGVCRV